MSQSSTPAVTDAIYDASSLGRPRMFLLGLQHLFAMFGATVLVPVLTGLSVSATLLFAGLGTLLFHFLSRGKVPAFLGSSFAFFALMEIDIAAIGKRTRMHPMTLLSGFWFISPLAPLLTRLESCAKLRRKVILYW